jgi:acyl phosphate:glycerol-3-phosphate acyltransferase
VHVFLFCVLSFLIGGIPFGYLTGRLLLKDDIRNHGSGNIGATNVGRVIGWKWGGIVLFLDALKGLLPTLAAMKFADTNLPESMHWHLPVAAGMSAIVGHMYPVYLKLRGGKGVATALGVVLVLAPKAVALAFIVFVLIAGTTRVVALASMLAAVVFGVAQLYLTWDEAFRTPNASLTAFAVGIPLLIIWRHRSNIARMLGRTESAISASKEDAK